MIIVWVLNKQKEEEEKKKSLNSFLSNKKYTLTNFHHATILGYSASNHQTC
jgi:hypothetical protein